MNLTEQLHQLSTVEEARSFLRCSRWKVHQLIKAGELASVKVGRARLIPREALEQLARPVSS